MIGNNVIDNIKWGTDAVVLWTISSSWKVMNESSRIIEIITPYIITFVSAIIIYFVWKFIAWILKKLFLKMFEKIWVDKFLKKTGIDKLKDIAWIDSSYSVIFSNIIYYVIYIAVIIAVLDKLWFNVVTDLIVNLINYIPNILIALTILILWTYVSNFIKELVTRVANWWGIQYDKLLWKISYFISMMFIVIVSIEQLQINIDIITNNLTIIIWSLCLISSIILGLALKWVATNVVSSTYLKNTIKKWDEIEIFDVSWEVSEINSTQLVVKTWKWKVYIPSEHVLNNIYTIQK